MRAWPDASPRGEFNGRHEGREFPVTSRSPALGFPSGLDLLPSPLPGKGKPDRFSLEAKEKLL